MDWRPYTARHARKTSFGNLAWNRKAIDAFLEEYGWREIEQVGSAEYQERYLEPLGRVMPVMQVERMVYAERKSNH